MGRVICRAAVFISCWLILSVCTAADRLAVPIITAGNPDAPTRIDFYLSPTCPMCAATFRNAVLPLLIQAARGRQLFVFVGILPRSPGDADFARVLTCVPQDKLLPFMTRWYFYRRTGEAHLGKLFHMGKQYGIAGQSVAECTSEQNDAMLLGFNQFVFAKERISETPAVFVNKKYVPEILYLWQLEDLLPELADKNMKDGS
jgi:hypothetical protein